MMRCTSFCFATAPYRLPLRRALQFIAAAPKQEPLGQQYEHESEQAYSHDVSSEKGASVDDSAARYAAYHCHHFLTAFRAERRLWSGRPLTLPELARVMDFTLFASVLLHLTGLHGTADGYCEDLIAAALSCTVFLSMSASQLRTTVAGNASPLPLDSLHWAVVHYSGGVCAWGLLDHTEPLLDARRTAGTCRVLLRTVANITRETLQPFSSVSNKVMTSYLDSIATSNGAAKWLCDTVPTRKSGEVSANEEDAEHTKGSVEFHGETYENHLVQRQQRRLQLLPLVWLSLLTRCAVSVKTLAAARHALLRVLPMFGCAAKADTILLLIASRLFVPPNPAWRASDAAMGALLAHMEFFSIFALPHACSALLQEWMATHEQTETATLPVRSTGAYAAFRAVPRCALTLSGGASFAHTLLDRALLGWSKLHHARVAPRRGEGKRLLMTAKYLSVLREDCMKEAVALVPSIDAALQAFAVRAAVLWDNIMPTKKTGGDKRNNDNNNNEEEKEEKKALVKFDAVLEATIGKGGSYNAKVPSVYKLGRSKWMGRSLG